MMSKKEMVRWYSNTYDVTIAEATAVINNISDMLEDIVAAGETARFPGIATIGVKMSKPRKLRDPQTGEIRMTEAHPMAFFKLGTRLKEAARNAPFVKG